MLEKSSSDLFYRFEIHSPSVFINIGVGKIEQGHALCLRLQQYHYRLSNNGMDEIRDKELDLVLILFRLNMVIYCVLPLLL